MHTENNSSKSTKKESEASKGAESPGGDHTPQPAKGEGARTGSKAEKRGKKDKGKDKGEKGEGKILYDRVSHVYTTPLP